MKRLAVLLTTLILGLALTPQGRAQLATSAFRALGQPDLRRNSFNSVDGSEFRGPSGLAIDTRGGAAHLYVADLGNNRVLAWQDGRTASNGQQADLVLGQPTLDRAAAFGIGNGGFNGPNAVAVHPTTGDVYVADSANNRVLRFPEPFAHPDNVEPNKVYGQPSFNSNAANNGGLSGRSMRNPTGLTFDSSGNLWVCDTQNHRVLRFPASALDADVPEADLALGQDLLTDGGANSSSAVGPAGFNTPIGIDFHANGSLYVADTNNFRVLVFQPPFVTGADAVRVIGQPDFSSRSVPPTITASAMRGPNAVFLTQDGNLLVTVQNENRVLVFDGIAAAGPEPAASRALGQPLLTSDFSNVNTAPLAGANGLSLPADVAADGDGNIYVTDAGNHRVVVYPPGVATASKVLGQPDFTHNTANRVGQSSLGAARDVIVDYSDENLPIYVADSDNNRVLMWRSSVAFRSGDPADSVIGQADFGSAAANADTGRGQSPTATSLSNPRGLALSSNGDLWVADTGNNRVLRYGRPVDQTERIRANLVLGQNDFFGASSAAVSATSLAAPRGAAIGPNGEIYVSDAGNHRVLEYPPDPSNGAAAIRVFGQSNFTTGTPDSVTSAQSLNAPIGLHVSDTGQLFVADAGANRILVFPLSPDEPVFAPSASAVIGQFGFDENGSAAGAERLNSPLAVTTNAAGEIIVADSGNHRILVFPGLLFLPSTGGAAMQVIGQSSFTGSNVNYNTPDGLATAEGLFGPSGLFSDRNETLYVADAGNNRVVHFLLPTGVVSAASFSAGGAVAPGSLVSLFGVNMSRETAAATTVPLPMELAGRTVELGDGKQAALLFASPGQFNVQLPVDASTESGRQSLAVRRSDTGELLAGGAISVSPASPGIFTASQDGQGAALAVNQDGSINGPSNPAARGSVVVFYGTGQGATSPMIATGQAAPGGPLANTTAQPTTNQSECLRQGFVCALVGAKVATVQYSGLAPGFVGLWQLNVQIPPDETTLTGDAVPVLVFLHGRSSNLVTIAIR